MGYIAAVINRHGEDASHTILEMLKTASDRTALSYGISDHRETENIKEPNFTAHTGSVLLASKNIFPEKYPPEPITQNNHSLVFNGIFLDRTEEPDSLSAAEHLNKNPVEGIEEILSTRVGAYAVAAITEDSILAGLDHIGTIPIYYGENRDTSALATNKKMLWRIGIEPVPLKPGKMIKITSKETIKTQIKALGRHKSKFTTSDILHEKMDKITQRYAEKTPKATVAFSGGIDSVLIAYYLKRNDVELELIWTGLEDQREEIIAQNAAEHLDIKLNTETYTLREVEETLDKVITSVEEPDPVKTGIAFPFHWAAEKTRKLGYTAMYSGNGADELFAGYMKYFNKHLKGVDPTKDIIRDVKNSYLQNFHRDTKTCLDQNIRLLLPFTHPGIIDYGLSIPIEQKLPDTRDHPRKIILRELAKKQGIPEKLADRPKKAAQYSSGVNKALKKIAKKHDTHLKKMIMERYLKIKREIVSRG